MAGNIFVDLLLGPQFDLPTVIVRRDCLAQAGLFDPDLRTGEDWDLWLRLAAFYRGCHLPSALAVCNISDNPGKYPLDMFEQCQIRILNRLFSDKQIAHIWPGLARFRGQLFSWHYAVLAKSNLRQGHARDFLRLASRSILSHPVGIYFLARSWRSTGARPCFVRLNRANIQLEVKDLM
jgi:hypothetical protein